MNIKVLKCGLFINQKRPWMHTTPDFKFYAHVTAVVKIVGKLSSSYCSSDLGKRQLTNCCLLKFFKNSINTVRTKIKIQINYKLACEITGYKYISHASKLYK